jgi:hypothetical protein
MRFPVSLRVRKGGVIVAVALVAGVLTSFGAAQAATGGAVAKPGPAAAPAAAGLAALDNAGIGKPGVPMGVPTAAPSQKVGPVRLSTQLNGYAVASAEFVSPAGSQVFGSVPCPTGKVAFGGGVLGNSFSVQQDVNSSFPFLGNGVATGWAGYVNNAGSDDSTFIVYAVCATKPANYAVVTASFDNPTGTQTSGSVACPIASTGVQMKPFGGGGIGSSAGLAQNINTSIPVKRGRSWRVDMNNATGSDALLTVSVVCGLKPGWTVIQGGSVANPAGSQSSAGASCTAGLTSVGGGLYSSSGSTSVNLNGTYPNTGSSWLGYENNASAVSATITPYVVCLS